MRSESPTEPSSVLNRDDHGGGRSLGVSLLDDLRASLSRDDIARYLADYGAGTGYDPSSLKLISATASQVDLHVEAHRVAVIGWLRSWGCRHLRRADTPRTAEALRLWWDAWAGRLPREHDTLNVLSEAALVLARQAFDALLAAPAAGPTVQFPQVYVAFSDTATANPLFPISPVALL